MKKIIFVSFLTFIFLYLVPLSLYPVFAAPIDIGSQFGFGNIKSLGQGTSTLVTPVFSIATGLVVLYFVFGVFDYISSGGSKEGVEKAQKKITQSIVGFIILMFAFLSLQFLLSALFNIEPTVFKIIG